MVQSATCAVGGVPVSCVTPEEVLAEMDAAVRLRRLQQWISITNTESMYYALRDPRHLAYIRGARFSLCDGIGVVLAGRARNKKIRRLNGPVLMLACCEYGVERGWRHFFYGGKEGVAEALSKTLTQRYPGMITAGMWCPPFRPLTTGEDAEVAAHINDSRPDIVWVGLGLLKQERWIADHLGKVEVPWMIGVGAAFDYHTGNAKWAPPWMRTLGLEWLYRLCHEPRMFIRYFRSFVFLTEAVLGRTARPVAEVAPLKSGHRLRTSGGVPNGEQVDA